MRDGTRERETFCRRIAGERTTAGETTKEKRVLLSGREFEGFPVGGQGKRFSSTGRALGGGHMAARGRCIAVWCGVVKYEVDDGGLG